MLINITIIIIKKKKELSKENWWDFSSHLPGTMYLHFIDFDIYKRVKRSDESDHQIEKLI